MSIEERECQRGTPFVELSSQHIHTTNTLTNKTKKDWVCCGFVAWQTHDEYQIICCIILQNFADLIKINHPYIDIKIPQFLTQFHHSISSPIQHQKFIVQETLQSHQALRSIFIKMYLTLTIYPHWLTSQNSHTQKFIHQDVPFHDKQCTNYATHFHHSSYSKPRPHT